jgi:ribonuclease PH
MRSDGRRPDELRPVSMTPDYIKYPEGSVLVTFGDTHVLCNVTVEERLPGWLFRSRARHGWVTAEYALLPRATQLRTERETLGLRGRTQEIRRLISRSLRAAVDLDLLGERQLIADCDVLQADGGTRSAAITGSYVALALAIRGLVDGGVIPQGALRRPVAAVSVGMVDGRPLLDLNYEEDSRAEVDLNVVMSGDGRFVEIQGTAEGEPFDRAAMDAMLDQAQLGIKQLVEVQRQVLAS